VDQSTTVSLEDYIRKSSSAIGSWFLAYKELGQNTFISFRIKKKDNLTHSIYNYDHSQHDGISCLNHLSQNEKFELYQNKNHTKLYKFKFFGQSLCLYLSQTFLFPYYARKRKFNIWKTKYSYNLNNKSDETNPKSNCFKISSNELNEIISFCKSSQINLNAHLLYCLNLAVRNYFKIIQETSWWIPVNFRSEFQSLDQTILNSASLNCVSNFTLTIQEKDTAKNVFQNMKNSLKNKLHWGVWAWQRIPLFLPKNIILALSKSQLKNNFYAGTFTNLGKWQSNTQFDEFYIFANTLPSHPIGASAIQINNTIYLGLQFHSCLLVSDDEIKIITENWKTLILKKQLINLE